MNKKTNIILLILIGVVFIGIIIVLVLKSSYKVNINLKGDIVEVNIFDKIDVKDYIVNVTDNRNNDLTNNVKISMETDEIDEVDGTNLFIKSYSDKVIKYTVSNNGNKVSKTLTIKVISDPNDENFNPNYDNNTEVNDYDKPDQPGDTNFTQEQQDYINSFLN